jgi:hypothetical protein
VAEVRAHGEIPDGAGRHAIRIESGPLPNRMWDREGVRKGSSAGFARAGDSPESPPRRDPDSGLSNA